MTEQSQCLIEQRISAESFSFYWIIIDLDVGSSIHSERFTRRLCNGKMNLFSIWGTTLTLHELPMGALLMFYLENFRVLSRHPLSPPSRQKLHLKRHHFYPLRVFFFSELLEQNIANSTQYTLASLSWKMQRQTILGQSPKTLQKIFKLNYPSTFKSFQAFSPSIEMGFGAPKKLNPIVQGIEA